LCCGFEYEERVGPDYILSGTSIPSMRIPLAIDLAIEDESAILNFSFAGSVSLKIGMF
jgi:hypothetical protein